MIFHMPVLYMGPCVFVVQPMAVQQKIIIYFRRKYEALYDF